MNTSFPRSKQFIVGFFAVIFGLILIQGIQKNVNKKSANKISPTKINGSIIEKPSIKYSLNPKKREVLRKTLANLDVEEKSRSQRILKQLDLTKDQEEIVNFLYYQPYGFYESADSTHNRYYSSWYDFTVNVPKDWHYITARTDQVGFLAPETDYDGDTYYLDKMKYDVFFHAACSKDEKFEDYIKKTVTARKEYYDFPSTSGPVDTKFVDKWEAVNYTMNVPVGNEYGQYVFNMTVEDYYLNIDGMYYFIVFRYRNSDKSLHRDDVEEIAASFNPGSMKCPYVDKFEKDELNEILDKMDFDFNTDI